eukprot:940167-Ditylum_brightwellii.AAC.1
MGKDIDYLFLELSALENSHQDDDDDNKSVASMLSAAKIKYTLGSVASSLRNVKDEDDCEEAAGQRQQQQQQETPKEHIMIDED